MLRLYPHPEATITGVAAALQRGDRTSLSVVEDCLSRIDEWEGKVHAWVRVDRGGALVRACELDDELRRGYSRGPLHGIPIGVKDLVDVAGWPTGAGSPRLSRQAAERDATLVTRLREAGAILLGKTVTTQFACFDPPPTRNPWNLERTPGGSSSGSAAAVATGMCLGAIGSQTGGSITRPASFCGVCGCKPTYGALPTDGVFPVAQSLDHPGPIARTVADLALLYDVLSATPMVHHSPASAPPRLARVRGLFDERVDLAMREAFERTLTVLASRGASLSEAALPTGFDDVLRLHRTIMLYELGQVHGNLYRQFPEDYLPGMRGLIEDSRSLSPDAYQQARQRQDALQIAFRHRQTGPDEVLVCPATVGPAPDAVTTGDPALNAPWTFVGLPTVSFPIGLSPDGLPLAVQLVGRSGDEAGLFRAALWCEGVVFNELLRAD